MYIIKYIYNYIYYYVRKWVQHYGIDCIKKKNATKYSVAWSASLISVGL